MRKKIKPLPPKHIIICDTNILWYEDKSVVVCPDFTKFWDKYYREFPMQLFIPEVVKGELLFQQTTSALKALDNANLSIEKVSGVTGKNYSHRITKQRVKKEVLDRFNKWGKSLEAKIIEVPINDINWNRVINDSIWRILPFTSDPKNLDNEKGFRDAMILETIATICKKIDVNISIAFLCNDFALRTTSEKRLSKYSNFSVYESLHSFESFIELTKQNLTDKFVKSILNRARKKFYSKSDDSLIFKENLILKINEEFEAQINNPSDFENVISRNLLRTSSEPWKESGKEQIWVVAPSFDKLEPPDNYHWISQITFVRPFFRKYKSFMGLTAFAQPYTEEERLRILTIDVKWSANVKADARFFNIKLNDYSLSSYKFEPPTDEEARRYGLSKEEP